MSSPPLAEQYANLARGHTARSSVRQWRSAKTTGDKLDLVFQNVADNDGRVETVTHVGGRDYIVFWSIEVAR